MQRSKVNPTGLMSCSLPGSVAATGVKSRLVHQGDGVK